MLFIRGGAELLFDNKKNYDLDLPESEKPCKLKPSL